jgi:hypothetical protein
VIEITATTARTDRIEFRFGEESEKTI